MMTWISLLKVYLQKNGLNTINVIFCDVIRCSINIYQFIFPKSSFWLFYMPIETFFFIAENKHCAKSVEIRSFFLVLIFPHPGLMRRNTISPYSSRIRENTDQKKLRIWTLFTHCMLMKKSALKSIHGCISYRKQNLNAWNVNK